MSTFFPRLACIILFIYFFSESIFSQSALQTKIDIQLTDINIVNSIKKISEISKINFTYDPAILPNNIVNKSFKDQSLYVILSNLLNEYNIGFDELSEQIILYKMPPKFISADTVQMQKETVKANFIKINNNKLKKIEKNNNTDTNKIIIKKTDTIYIAKYDTLILYDTITFIQKDTIKKLKKSCLFDSIYKKPLNTKNLYISIDLLGSSELGNIQLSAKNNNKVFTNELKEKNSSIRGYSVMGLANFQFSNFIMQTGLGYKNITQKINFIKQTPGGYYINDTIEKYYTSVQNQDTNWLYVFNEKWIETSIISEHKTSLSFHYMQVPLFIGYSLRIKNLSIGINTGIITEIPIKTNGYGFFDTTSIRSNTIEKFDTSGINLNNPNFSMQLSLSANYLIKNNLCLVIKPYYYKNLK